MADTENTNQETEQEQTPELIDVDTEVSNNSEGLTAQELAAEQQKLAKFWEDHIKKTLKAQHSEYTDDQLKAAAAGFKVQQDKDGGLLLPSPNGGGTLKYRGVENRDGTYTEQIIFSKQQNGKKKFNQQAADDIVKAARSLGWKGVDVTGCFLESKKDMLWLAVQKENMRELVKHEMAGGDPSTFKPVMEVNNYMGSAKAQQALKEYYDKLKEINMGGGSEPGLTNAGGSEEPVITPASVKTRFMVAKEGQGFPKAPFTKNKETQEKAKLEALEKKVINNKVETIGKNLCVMSEDPIKLQKDLEKLGIKGRAVAIVPAEDALGSGAILMNSVELTGNDAKKFEALKQKHAKTLKIDPSKISIAKPENMHPKPPLIKKPKGPTIH